MQQSVSHSTIYSFGVFEFGSVSEPYLPGTFILSDSKFSREIEMNRHSESN